MSIATVIAALTERLGPLDTTGDYRGNPTASWGRTQGYGPGVDAFVTAKGFARVDCYTRELMPVIVEGHGDPKPAHPLSKYTKRIGTFAEFEAYKAPRWPIIAPLDVAVAIAARTMGRA